MAAPAANLFLRLHKWAARQDENFLTESLALLLEFMLARSPEFGVRWIKRLTDGVIDLPPEDASAVEVCTQVETAEGRPDLEIRAPERLVWLEAKAESPLRAGQLEGYRIGLGASGVRETRLILLTRYAVAFAPDAEKPDLALQWYEAAEWVEEALGDESLRDEVSRFLCEQFLAFLKERRMAIAHVGWQMPEGVKALGSLLDMFAEAAGACGVSARKRAFWGEVGYKLDGGKYWIGVNFDDPSLLWFATLCRINPEAAAALGGEITHANWIPGAAQWLKSADLSSEEVHFFSRTKGGQIQWLIAFLRECLEQARSITTPDQPPIPDEPEEE
jgi:hypothetical protein